MYSPLINFTARCFIVFELIKFPIFLSEILALLHRFKRKPSAYRYEDIKCFVCEAHGNTCYVTVDTAHHKQVGASLTWSVAEWRGNEAEATMSKMVKNKKKTATLTQSESARRFRTAPVIYARRSSTGLPPLPAGLPWRHSYWTRGRNLFSACGIVTVTLLISQLEALNEVASFLPNGLEFLALSVHCFFLCSLLILCLCVCVCCHFIISRCRQMYSFLVRIACVWGMLYGTN